MTKTKNDSHAVTINDSEDNCIECGLQIASQRQIEQPGCCLCQVCAEVITGEGQLRD